MELHGIDGRTEGQKLLKFLQKAYREAPDSFFRKMLRKKNITLNGRRADGSELLKAGDEVRVFVSDEVLAKFKGGGKPEADKLPGKLREAAKGIDVVYFDEDFLFVSKPAGLLTQGDKRGEAALSDIICQAAAEKTGRPVGEFYGAAPVHRLDRNTSGLVLCGVTVKGKSFLSKMIAARKLKKEYLALCEGDFAESLRCTAYLKKDRESNKAEVRGEPFEGASRIVTDFRPIGRGRGCTLLSAELVTGRPHQIRASLSFLGHPVAGDVKYGGKRRLSGCELEYHFLHAESVAFPEGLDEFGRLSGRVFEAALPEDKKGVLDKVEISGIR